MAGPRIDSDRLIERKIMTPGAFGDRYFQQRISFAKAEYIKAGRARERKNVSDFMSGSIDSGPSTYDSRSVEINRRPRGFEIVVSAASQPEAETGNESVGAYIRKKDLSLTLPIKPSKVAKYKRAGAPVMKAGPQSRFYRSGRYLLLAKRVRTHPGHQLLLRSVIKMFRRI